MGNTLLRLTDLTVDFASQEGTVHAVNRVTFEVAPGELVGLVGESGCGKSVTASAIIGLTGMVPNATVSGSIEFIGRDLLTMAESDVRAIRGRDISMIFQDPVTSLNPVLNIERLMTEGLELHLGLSHADAVTRSIELLGEVGIPKAANRIKDYPHQFSGGMRQRVMIAIAISCNPKLLLADEPTTALDVTIQAQILRLLKKLAREHEAAVIVDHPRPRRRRRHVPAHPRDVRRAHRRERRRPSRSSRTRTTRTPWGCSRASPRLERAARRDPADHRRTAARPGQPAARLRVRAAVLSGHRRVLGGRARARGHRRTAASRRCFHSGQLREDETARCRRDRPSPAGRRPGHSGHRRRHLGDDTLVRIEDLRVHFPITSGVVFQRKVGAVYAVDGLTFDVRRGETLGLVGESGCGKSTTGRAILQLIRPTTGRVLYEGGDLANLKGEPPARAAQAHADDLPGPVREPEQPHDRSATSSASPCWSTRWATKSASARRKVRELLETVGINPNTLNRYPHEFSGGQRQRIGIARALAVEPELHRLRRADQRPGRVDQGADHQPAAAAAAGVRAHLPVHRARPQRRAAHLATGSR